MLDRPAPGVFRRRFGALPVLALLSVLIGVPGSAWQASSSQGPVSRVVDRTEGESEQIERRREWFLSTRTQGVGSLDELADLRLQGVRDTRLALARQRALRNAEGGTTNPWTPMGPSPSTFGGWAFGNVSGRITALAADWDGGTLYVGTAAGGVWVSTNDGLSWTQIFDNAGTHTVGAVAVDPNDPGVLWVGTGDNVSGCESYFGIGMLRSADGGQTWEPRNGSGGATLQDMASFADVVVDPRDSDHVVTGGRLRQCQDGSGLAGGLFSTADGGMTWTQRIASVSVYEIKQDPSVLDTWWAATANGIYKSVDNAQTWLLQTASGLPAGGTGRTELAIAPSDSSTVYALFSSPLSLWRTTDGGATWTQRSTGSNACDGQCSYNMVLRVDPFAPDTVIRGTVHLFRSTNGASSWADLSNNWGSNQTVHQDTHVLLMHPTIPGTFFVGSDGGVWKTTDGGDSFQNRNGNLNVTQFYAIGVRADDPGWICGGAQDNSSLVRTGSNTWDLQAVSGDGFVCHFAPDDASYAYITSYPSGGYPSVWRSTSGAFGGFADITGPGSGVVQNDRSNWVTPYIIDPQTPTTLYLGTHRVYRSDDRGSSWTQVGPTDLTGGSGSLVALEVNRNFADVVYSGSQTGRVWRSTDRGDTFVDITAGLPGRSVNDLAGDPGDPDRAFAVVGGFNTAHLWEWTLDGGWTARDGGLPNVPHNTVLMLDPDDILVGTDVGIFRSADGGQTFVPYMNGLPEGLVVTDLKYNAAQNVVTAGTYGRGAWQSPVDPVGPILLYDSVQLPYEELDGDGDDRVEPGETWRVRVRLRNGGGETATGVAARLATAMPDVTILDPIVEFGDIDPGETAMSPAFDIVIDPSATCGATAAFDLVDLSSTNVPGGFADAPDAFALEIADEYLPGPPQAVFDDDFDPAPEAGWTSASFTPGVAPCAGFPYYDEWQVAVKDGARGQSYHCGGGPGATYTRRDFSWLYYGGRDSTDGPGIAIPADALSAEVTVEHWYETVPLADGGQVVIDAVEDGQDDYVTLVPQGGYPAGTLATGFCNGLEGQPAFHGSSGGWMTSTFDLLQYKGRTVYLAFLFATDTTANLAEGWYVDRVTVEVAQPGEPVCDVAEWPGRVPPTVLFDYDGAGAIEATWTEACADPGAPGQSYSIQVGDLGALRASGVYDVSPAAADCGRVSPATFAPGTGDEYYLVVPVDEGRQGGAGADGSGGPRALPDGVCGPTREAVCD